MDLHHLLLAGLPAHCRDFHIIVEAADHVRPMPQEGLGTAIQPDEAGSGVAAILTWKVGLGAAFITVGVILTAL
jgi:hypothetical protein